jgi:hypothetical protein
MKDNELLEKLTALTPEQRHLVRVKLDELVEEYESLTPEARAASWDDTYGVIGGIAMNYESLLSGLSDDEIEEALNIIKNLPREELPIDESLQCLPTEAFGLKCVIRHGDTWYSYQQGCAVRQRLTGAGFVYAFFKDRVQIWPVAGTN